MSDCCNENSKKVLSNVDLKHLDGLICFCFKKSKKDLFEAVKSGKENLFIDDIKFKIKNTGCFCKTKNPSGECCLNDIQAFSVLIRQEINSKS